MGIPLLQDGRSSAGDLYRTEGCLDEDAVDVQPNSRRVLGPRWNAVPVSPDSAPEVGRSSVVAATSDRGTVLGVVHRLDVPGLAGDDRVARRRGVGPAEIQVQLRAGDSGAVERNDLLAVVPDLPVRCLVDRGALRD